ncbi:VOC family protein [Spiractinospora alimapuensis]|uniref:VOC family protein n=1 Tax=Spiractinospora alimapuensis TaxID=2820884 RepID=UPI003741E9A6
MLSLGLCALLVEDYDEAIAYYTGRLGFHLVQDTDLGGGKRWVVVAPSSLDGARILLARAVDDVQRSRVGGQTGGRVGWFLYTDSFPREHARLRGGGRRVRGGPARGGLRHRRGVSGPLREPLGSHRAGLSECRGTKELTVTAPGLGGSDRGPPRSERRTEPTQDTAC